VGANIAITWYCLH